jgi:hypothetical protein
MYLCTVSYHKKGKTNNNETNPFENYRYQGVDIAGNY